MVDVLGQPVGQFVETVLPPELAHHYELCLSGKELEVERLGANRHRARSSRTIFICVKAFDTTVVASRLSFMSLNLRTFHWLTKLQIKRRSSSCPNESHQAGQKYASTRAQPQDTSSNIASGSVADRCHHR